MRLHEAGVAECVRLMNEADAEAPRAVAAAAGALTALIADIEPGFVAGGRLVYVGAGTSGRLGVLDASEIPPTFQAPPGRVIGLIAGGDAALRTSSESKEDDPAGAVAELADLHLDGRDAVIGIAAGGTTPYALGALAYAGGLGPAPVTGLICCTPVSRPPGCRHVIALPTGPEIITGSTRLKAGTATKLVLNTISTTLMVREGRVYENLMVDLRATNAKLRDRAGRIVSTLTGLGREAAFDLLDLARGEVKTAVLMHRASLSAAAARERMDRHQGRLHHALSETTTPWPHRQA
jgi:N-acetylmuramic acid 6-phosphate etherase